MEILAAALRKTLDWMDAIPQSVVLPAMPGFDRDDVEETLDYRNDAEAISEALEWAMGWVAAVPADVKSQLPVFDRAEMVEVLRQYGH